MDIKTKNVEYFDCDCHDRDHLIRASYETWPNKNQISSREIMIEFRTSVTDDALTYQGYHPIYNLYVRFLTRIKLALRMLFLGKINSYGYFIPCRTIESEDYTVENIFGYQTTKNLAKWLDIKSDELKRDFDADMAKYNKKIPDIEDKY